MQIRTAAFLAAVLLSLGSCKVRLNPTDCNASTGAIDTTTVSSLYEEQFEIGMITLRAKAEMTEKNNTQSFDVHFRIIEDSAVWVRVSSLGIEGMRLLVEKDTVTLINRLAKTYVHTSTDRLREIAGVNFDLSQLQAFLVGNPLHKKDQMKMDESELLGSILSVFDRGLRYSYQLNECNRLNAVSSADLQSDQSFSAKYSDFKKVRKRGIMPGTIQVSVNGPQQQMDLKLRYNNVSTEEFRSLRITIPSRYANALE